MSVEPNLFQRFMFEAPGDDTSDNVPPDEAQMDTTGPPDIPDNADPTEGPPDVSDEPPNTDDDLGGDDAPPDMGDGGFEDDDFSEFEDDPGGGNQSLDLDDKVSAIMNVTLYQTFLSLVGDINERLTTIKHNTDMFYTLSDKSLDIIPDLKKLDENIRLYLKNTFIHERYEKNLLFFNKCMNLFKLLGDKFNAEVSKGIKEYK